MNRDQRPSEPQSLSDQTGGVAFFPKDLVKWMRSARKWRGLRNQYSITCKPTNPRSNGGYRR
jgi:hypothetical protein